MNILLTNDDGIHASGIIEFAKVIRERHEVFIVAPRTEQSGISQAITFLRPLFPIELGSDRDSDGRIPGYSLDGTPTDCVKLALFELCPFQPDLIVSGINAGLNAGVNVCYSGTVAGAIAGTMFGFPAMAVSLEYGDSMNFRVAAEVILPIMERLCIAPWPDSTALNINIPTAAITGTADFDVVPVETNPLGYHFDKGLDPKGRPFYWSNNKPDPKPSDFETDVSVLLTGRISVSPITFNMNAMDSVENFRSFAFDQQSHGS